MEQTLFVRYRETPPRQPPLTTSAPGEDHRLPARASTGRVPTAARCHLSDPAHYVVTLPVPTCRQPLPHGHVSWHRRCLPPPTSASRERGDHVTAVFVGLGGLPVRGRMEDEEEEARSLLAGDGALAPPATLPAICDPSRLAHRLVVLLLMCFLGFGEPSGTASSRSPNPLQSRSRSLP